MRPSKTNDFEEFPCNPLQYLSDKSHVSPMGVDGVLSLTLLYRSESRSGRWRMARRTCHPPSTYSSQRRDRHGIGESGGEVFIADSGVCAGLTIRVQSRIEAGRSLKCECGVRVWTKPEVRPPRHPAHPIRTIHLTTEDDGFHRGTCAVFLSIDHYRADILEPGTRVVGHVLVQYLASLLDGLRGDFTTRIRSRGDMTMGGRHPTRKRLEKH
jgi:hypothetical protein